MDHPPRPLITHHMTAQQYREWCRRHGIRCDPPEPRLTQRSLLTAEEAAAEARINARIKQAVESERWKHRNEVAEAVAQERERCAAIAEEPPEKDVPHSSWLILCEFGTRIAERIRRP